MPQGKPNFFIVGLPRSGSTSLYHYLRVHPDVFMPFPTKEPMFFCEDFDGLIARPADNMKDYLSLFTGVGDEQAVGDCSTMYLSSSVAAARLHEFNPAGRIILILREPVDWLHSFFYMRRYYRLQYDAREFRELVEDELAGKPCPPEQIPHLQMIKGLPDDIQRYFDTFSKEQVQVLLFEDLKADTPRVYREILEFIGVDPTFEPPFEVHNPHQVPRNELLAKLFASKSAHAVRKAIDYLPFADKILDLQRRVSTKKVERPEMDDDLGVRLHEEFLPTVKALDEMLGMKLEERWYGS